MKNVVVVLMVLIIGGIGGVKFYLPKFVDARIHDQIVDATTAIQKQNDQLAEVMKSLEARQQKLEKQEFGPAECSGFSFDIDFNRWNCWCDLKDKFLCGSDYSTELIRFRAMFSDCSDLLEMVDSIITEENNETKENTLINNLRKFCRIRGINERKLERITGCVILSSIRKVGEDGRRECK